MKKIILLFAVGFALVAANCNEDDCCPPEQTGTLELNFKGYFGDELLEMYAKDYNYEAGMALKLQLFRFYISNLIPLMNTPDQQRYVEEVALVDFETVQSDAAAEQGVSIRLEKVPVGNYIGLQMGLGLTEKLNATNPGDYSTDHPLSDNYWSWALGYVFTKIEGNADINGDGVFNDKLTFHIGGNQFYRPKEFSKDFTVKADQTTRLDFEVDLRKVLVAGEGNFLDFRKVTIDHTNNMEVATFISNNLANAVVIK